ncbi:MAG: FAD-dependent monooxygenase [Okeania sp. SIO3I5]|nr:FAD-dependent monooxygenase [Okeania sp. SIO3I5]
MKPENSTPKIDYDVAIVGAGPVGLATALGLRQRGIKNIIVLDQTRAFRQVGQTIGLLPNGMKALRYIHTQAHKNLTEEFKKSKNPLKEDPSKQKWTMRNVNGEKIPSPSKGLGEIFGKYGEHLGLIPWYELQTQLRRLLPENLVKPNHRFISVVAEPEFQCVRADFVSNLGAKPNPYSYWEDQQKKARTNTESSSQFPESEITSIRAKLLIGADGINSTVRQSIYKDTPYSAYSKPKYSGFSGVQTEGIYQVPEALSQQIKEQFFDDAKTAAIYNYPTSETSTINQEPTMKMLIWSYEPGEFEYLIDAIMPFESLAGKVGKDLIDSLVLELKKANFPEIIQRLVALSPPENLANRPFYIHPVNIPAPDRAKWSIGRVVLVGDAAHGMPPVAGQGANQGMEDAAAIATLVAKINQQNQWDDTAGIETAFDKYESLRRPIVEIAQEGSMRIRSFYSEWHEQFAEEIYGRNIAEIMQTLL